MTSPGAVPILPAIMKTIDAHIHFAGDHEDCVAMLEELDIKALNICIADPPGHWKEQKQIYRAMRRAWPARYAWCTSFDPPDFRDSRYAERVMAELDQDFAAGANACKVWKNIGLECRTPSNEYVMVDDPIFSPVFEHLEKAGRPVLMHIGEPMEAWQPVNKASPHNDYYGVRHPEWHFYGKPDFPPHERLIAARDRVVERYPRIRFVGAHLASLEYDLSEVGRRLDRYPNLMVDIAARIIDAALLHDTQTLRSFLDRYCERVIYGSDAVMDERHSALSPDKRAANVEKLRGTYRAELDFFSSSRSISYKGREVRGVGLPAAAVERITLKNAASWYAID